MNSIKLTFVKNYKPKKIDFWFKQYKLLRIPYNINKHEKNYNIEDDKNKFCKLIGKNNYGDREIFGLTSINNLDISPKVYNIYCDNNNYYIIMKKYNQSLLDILNNPYYDLSLKELLIVMKLSMININYMHNSKLSHRNLTLNNIVTNKEINDIRFINFSHCADLNYDDRLINYGSFFYKPRILCNPEINKYIKHDLFSLGMILSMLFTEGKYNEAFFYNNSIKQNKKILYESILNNYHEDIFYGKYFDTDDIISLTDIILYFLYNDSNIKSDFYKNVIYHLDMKIDNYL